MNQDDEEALDESHCHNFNVRTFLGFHDRPAESAELLNNLLSEHLPLGITWTISQRQWNFEFNGLRVLIQNDDGLNILAFSDVMSRKILDPLRVELRSILKVALGVSVFDTTAFGVMLLQMAEEADGYVQQFRESSMPSIKQLGWNASSVLSYQEILDNPYGVDLSSVNDTANYILGKPIGDICSDLPEYLRILHVEPVFRADLVSRFLRRKAEMKEELMSLPYNQIRKLVTRGQIASGEVLDTHDSITDHLTKPKITFHGAPRHVISSIVRYGFLVPGQQIGRTKAEVTVASGSSLGVGIYSSPSLEYASYYGRWTSGSGNDLDFFNPSQVPGFRMLVCATLMGRSLEVDWSTARGKTEVVRHGAHSHVAPNHMEYVVFDKAQIVPCYVLHVDYGSDVAKAYIQGLMKNPSNIGKSKSVSRVQLDAFEDDIDCPGARKAKKEALKAAAAKWFPYGYGPATGTSFMIEEIGYVSDDEEEYGEFQAVRGEQGHEIQEWIERKDEKASWLDEYQYVRNTNKEVRKDM